MTWGAGSPAEAAAMLAGALLWDRLWGEPPSAVHPVVWIGRTIGALERRALRGSPGHELAQGLVLALGVPALFATAALLVMSHLDGSPLLRLLIGTWLLKSTLAIRALGAAAGLVHAALKAGDLPAARHALRSLCSRDPAQLDAPAVAAGAVESVAENCSDSAVAPLFFFALFGLPGAIAYRAINTADAMIGYHGRHEYLGKAAARLDDLANWLPARLTAALLLVAAGVRGLPVRRGWHILVRDGSRTESPNAGRPMATMAGVLGVRLEKPGHYALGDAIVPLDEHTVARAWQLAATAAYTGAFMTLLWVLEA